MSPETIQALQTIALGLGSALLGGLVPAIFSYRATVNRLDSEKHTRVQEGKKLLAEAGESLANATKAQVDTMIKMVQEMRLDVEKTRDKCKDQETKIQELVEETSQLREVVSELLEGSLILIRQLEKAGIDPKWRPPKKLEKIINGGK